MTSQITWLLFHTWIKRGQVSGMFIVKRRFQGLVVTALLEDS